MFNNHGFLHAYPITRRCFQLYSGLGTAAVGIGACARGALSAAPRAETVHGIGYRFTW